MSLQTEAKQRLGDLIMMGFQGPHIQPATLKFLNHAKIGGIIYFKHNYESVEQILETSKKIQENRGNTPPLWISVDHEGGRVQRFGSPFTKIPAAKSIAETGSPKLAFEIYEAAARELAAVGINLNFCPVGDINTNPKNPVIGDRAFGSDEETVSPYVSSAVRGHLQAEVQPCVKHFPGHGDTHVDSHFSLPTIQNKLELLRTREFLPFKKAFRSGCQIVMSAHILNPEIDPQVPGTLSKATLQGLLRNELGYSGLILSDDMEMQAITDHFGIDSAPVKAINAGCDQLIYRSEERARAAYASLEKALEDGSLDAARVIESSDRSRKMRLDLIQDPLDLELLQAKKLIGCKDHQALVEKVLNHP